MAKTQAILEEINRLNSQINIGGDMASNYEILDQIYPLYDLYFCAKRRALAQQVYQEHMVPLSKLVDGRKTATDYLWLTVSPPEGTNAHDLLERCEAFARLSVNKAVIFCLEQRGSTEGDVGKGCHAHLLCCRAKKVSAWRGEALRAFQPLYEKKLDFQNSFFKLLNCGETDIGKRLLYLKGTKQNIGNKADKCRMDVIFRQRLSLKPFYVIGECPHFPC